LQIIFAVNTQQEWRGKTPGWGSLFGQVGNKTFLGIMENCGQKSKDPLGVQQRSGVQSQDNAETNLRMVMETKTEIPSCRQAFKTFYSAVLPSIIKL